MKTENLLKLIGKSESTIIEWKPSLSQINEIIETISAFANSEGGKIFVGACLSQNSAILPEDLKSRL